ncbi:hypothetical protein ONZ45_g9720 [Pleurotus djamor]|nr:hypothetical protein ONZ45_g9720 [Pleurotus djamor]
MRFEQFPHEIYLIIFRYVDRKGFLSLLRTSRFLHSLVEPFLYHEIKFYAPRRSKDLLDSRIDKLKGRLIHRNPRLASHVKSIEVPNLSKMQTMLPLFINLRRLIVAHSYASVQFEPIGLFSSLKPITHLISLVWCHQISDIAGFTTFLSSQTDLGYLHVQHISPLTNEHDFPEPPTSALPLLRTLICDVKLAKAVLPGRHVRNLHLNIGRLPPHATRPQTHHLNILTRYPSIETLKCLGENFEKVVEAVTHFPEVKDLKVYCPRVREHAISSTFTSLTRSSHLITLS